MNQNGATIFILAVLLVGGKTVVGCGKAWTALDPLKVGFQLWKVNQQTKGIGIVQRLGQKKVHGGRSIA